MNRKRYTIGELVNCRYCSKEMLVIRLLNDINFTKKTYAVCPECLSNEDIREKAIKRYGLEGK